MQANPDTTLELELVNISETECTGCVGHQEHQEHRRVGTEYF